MQDVEWLSEMTGKEYFFFISKFKKNHHGSLMRAVQFFCVISENLEVKNKTCLFLEY